MNKKTEIRVDDLYATSRCLKAIIDRIEEDFTKAIFSTILIKIDEMIEGVKTGKIKTEAVTKGNQ